MKKRTLICGISGQDGAYIANLLSSKGYKFLAPRAMHRVRVLLTYKSWGLKAKLPYFQ